ncbi:MAG: nitroreductase family protein [Candidatus Hodarchaeaceae archaeon]|nr:nitroreductase family protein [Candidatus Hodarchaeaceae archaeon]
MSFTKIDDLLKLMGSRGTARRFKSDPIPEECTEKILQAARRAPSGANAQPWDFIVIEDRGLKEKIAQILVDAHREARKEDMEFPYEDDERLRRRFMDAPVLIAVCADPRFMAAYPKAGYREAILYVSMGAAIQNMMLAANACGLALSWGTVDSLCRDELRRLLGVPEPLLVFEVLQLGYPAEGARPRFRRHPRDFTHRDVFDTSKLRSDEEIKNLLSTRRSPDIYSGRK